MAMYGHIWPTYMQTKNKIMQNTSQNWPLNLPWRDPKTSFQKRCASSESLRAPVRQSAASTVRRVDNPSNSIISE